jgi:hypothetical protein
MNFSEPIDQNHARPTRIAAPLMAVAPGEPQWNAEGTQLTIYLRTPLPAGVRLFAVFEQGDFRDLNGNVNAAADSASLTVAGNVDYIPIHTDWQWLYERWGEENPVRKEPYEEYVKVQFENRSGSRFDWTEYRWDSYYEVWEESDRLYMEKNATGLYLRGFDGDGDDVTFSPSVVYQPLPFAVGDWDGTATASTGDGDAELAYEGEIVGQSIIVWENGGSGEPNLVWEGVWQSILHHQITAGLEVVEVGTDTLWYAPGLGLLQQYSSGTEETDEGTVQWWSRMRLEELWFDR